MWSLPDINAMNLDAELKFKAKQKAGGEPGPVTCDDCGTSCRPGEPYYDIFGPHPKGTINRCESCQDRHGSTPEGYFTCEVCERVMIENYTWELYCKDGICLNCYAERVISNPNNPAWINLSKASGEVEGFTFDRIKQAPHIIAVSGPTHGLKFHVNVEFDSTDGHRISGGGVKELQERCLELRRNGHKRALIILDAGYQFAVSIGLYTIGTCKWGRNAKATAALDRFLDKADVPQE